MCRLYNRGRPGELFDKGERTGIFVKLVLTADKPFHCKALGRRSFAHDYFSPQCDCTRAKLYDLSHDLETHYDGIRFETRCARALVPLWLALEEPEPEDWIITCPDTGKARRKP